MKRSVFILVTFLALASRAVGQGTTPVYGINEAGSHVGDFATVRGQVAGVFDAKNGNYFLTMGGQYPNQSFSAVILKNSASRFSNIEEFVGKTIEVTGRIKSYGGKPEIILDKPSQFRIVG